MMNTKDYVLKAARDAAQQRVRCLGLVSQLGAEMPEDTALTVDKAYEALDRLGAEIGLLTQLRANYQSLRAQAVASGDIEKGEVE